MSRENSVEVVVIPALTCDMALGMMKRQFSGGSFLELMLEIVKNSVGWGNASLILLDTTNRLGLGVVDDGEGMPHAYRERFIRTGDQAPTGTANPNKFDTGVKRVLFSVMSDVRARTIAKLELDQYPDTVIEFNVVTDDYEVQARERRQIQPRGIRKDRKSWPYLFPTGTEFKYRFANPNSRAILRGEKLAAHLADRLPRSFRQKIRVDGHELPAKQARDNRFYDPSDASFRSLGPVIFELYIPEGNARQQLWLATTEDGIGEVSLMSFFEALTDELREFFPKELLVAGIAGTIVPGELLKRWINEDRKSLASGINDDPAIIEFLKALKKHTAAALEILGIETKVTIVDEQAKAENDHRDFATRCNQRYDPKGEGPPVIDGPYGPPVPPPGPPVPPGGGQKGGWSHALTITGYRHDLEYEPNETIQLTVRLRDDLAERYTLDQVIWRTDKSGCKGIKIKSDGTITLVADKIGDREITVEVPGQMFARSQEFKIVEQRQFSLRPANYELAEGEQFTVRAINADKLTGQINWSVKGPREPRYEIIGNDLVFYATREGIAEVVATDSANPLLTATCTIRVKRKKPKDSIKIRGTWFRFETVPSTLPDALMPAKIGPSRDGLGIHQLTFNPRAPGYKEASQSGRSGLHQFLALATALEFLRYQHLFGETSETASVEPNDEFNTIGRREAFTIFAEICGGNTEL